MKIKHVLISLVLFVAGSAGGCLDRSAPGLQNNANNNANTNSNGNSNGNSNVNSNSNSNNQGECRSADDCSLAIKYDDCCACPRPASQEDMDADPCLLPVGTEDIPEECQVICPAMPCEQCLDEGKTVTCREGRCEWFEGHCGRDEDCVLGIRTDNCCTAAMPVTKNDIHEDQCLTYWPIQYIQIPQSCYDQWDPMCEMVDCAPIEPWSRAVACQDDEGGKMCRFVPECDNRYDCAVLVDTRSCCPCPAPWPLSMKSHDPCLVDPGVPPPASCAPTNCPEMPCPSCNDVSVECQDHRCVSLEWYQDGRNGGR